MTTIAPPTHQRIAILVDPDAVLPLAELYDATAAAASGPVVHDPDITAPAGDPDVTVLAWRVRHGDDEELAEQAGELRAQLATHTVGQLGGRGGGVQLSIRVDGGAGFNPAGLLAELHKHVGTDRLIDEGNANMHWSRHLGGTYFRLQPDRVAVLERRVQELRQQRIDLLEKQQLTRVAQVEQHLAQAPA